MEIVIGIFIVIIVLVVVIYGKIKGAPDPSRMTDQAIAHRLRTESAWITKFLQQPYSSQQSESLKRMYEEKTRYVEELNGELAARYPQKGIDAIEKELEPIIGRVSGLVNQGESKETAITIALNEWKDQAEERQYEIQAGIGLRECSLGMLETDFRRLFGGVDRKYSIDGKKFCFISSKDNGVDVLIENGRIKTMFFFFSSDGYRPFCGETDKGIGRSSSIDDVVESYGRPDILEESESASSETSIDVEYSQLGINFTFQNNILKDIRCLSRVKI